MDEFTRLTKPIARLMGLNALLLPGTHFGPLIGKAKGMFADFAWLLPWTLLATRASLGWMRDRVAKIDAVTPELTFRSADHPTLVELQLEPQGELVLPPLGNPSDLCEACGRDPRSMPDEIVIERSSIPENLDIFRARNFTTLVLATNRFVKAVKDLGLVGLRFEPVGIRD